LCQIGDNVTKLVRIQTEELFMI